MMHKNLITLSVLFFIGQLAYAAPKNNKATSPTLEHTAAKTQVSEPIQHTAAPKPGELIKREPEKLSSKKPSTIKEHISETLKSHSKEGKAPSNEDTENLSKIAQNIKTKDQEIAHSKAAHEDASTPEEAKSEIKKGIDTATKARKSYWEMFESEVKNAAEKIGADAQAAWEDIKKHF